MKTGNRARIYGWVGLVLYWAFILWHALPALYSHFGTIVGNVFGLALIVICGWIMFLSVRRKKR